MLLTVHGRYDGAIAHRCQPRHSLPCSRPSSPPLSAAGCARRFTQELAAFELKPTYEDVFPGESRTVEEYLQQVHEMTVISAIQVRVLGFRADLRVQT